MSAGRRGHELPDGNNTRRSSLILWLAAPSALIYLLLALAGDLRARPAWLLAGCATLAALGLSAWWLAQPTPAHRRLVLGAALAFRLLAALGEPALSDDVYRYVWDGRVQVEGIHPYRYPPAAPELESLRDDDWTRINHPQLRTIYPPLAEALFALLALVGAGPLGFRWAFGLIDFGVVLVLDRVLCALRLPRERLILYAWNPLAILESAGSGHVEPLGVLFVLLAGAWTARGRSLPAAAALAAAVQTKLIPLALLPGFVRRWRGWPVLVLALVVAGLVLPYAATGPTVGGGLFEYAERWQYNAFVFAGVVAALEQLDSGESLKPVIAALRSRVGDGLIPWDAVYRHAWPQSLARWIVVLAALVWIARLTFRRGLDPLRESFLALGGVLLLSPTLHPWYVLWVLPLAAAYLSLPWLVFGLLVLLSYAAEGPDVAWWLRCVEYLPLFALLAVEIARGRFFDEREARG